MSSLGLKNAHLAYISLHCAMFVVHRCTNIAHFMLAYSSASTSPEIQEFSGIFGISRIEKVHFENKKNQELVASYTIDIEDWNIL